ncbi:hypothetical protein BDR04DRAFT_1156966 [Suillus decipiens]|nr:hypothetical protein BDR04DRAFT_1156966 [Suillus decipiens]
MSKKELSLAIYALLQLREREAHLLALHLQHVVATDLEPDQDEVSGEGESYDPSGDKEIQTPHTYLTYSITQKSHHHPHVEGENLQQDQEAGARLVEQRSRSNVNWEIVTRKHTAAMLEEEAVESEKEPDTSEDDDSGQPHPQPSNCSYSPSSFTGGPSKKPYVQTSSHQKVNTISDLLAHNSVFSEEEGNGDENTRMIDDDDRNKSLPSGDVLQEKAKESVSLKKKNTVLEDQEVEVGVDVGDSMDTPISSNTSKWKAKVNLSEFSTPQVSRVVGSCTSRTKA